MNPYEEREWMRPNFRLRLDFRAHLAVDLLRAWGAVAGSRTTVAEEDSSGRGGLTLLAPADLVNRCLTITRLMVNALEARGWLAPDGTSDEELMRVQGRLERIQHEASWKVPSGKEVACPPSISAP